MVQITNIALMLLFMTASTAITQPSIHGYNSWPKFANNTEPIARAKKLSFWWSKGKMRIKIK
jgi:hypothetical protein